MTSETMPPQTSLEREATRRTLGAPNPGRGGPPGARRRVRLLFLTAEHHPTFRPDVAVLFGRCLPAHGVGSDLATLAAAGTGAVPEWGGGDALLHRTAGGAMRRRLTAMVHGLRVLLRADPGRYSAVQVRDMPVLAGAAILIAARKGLPMYYWMSYPIPEGQLELARERRLSAGLMKFLYPWISGHAGRWSLRHLVLPRATHLFVQSPAMQRDLEALGVPAARMTPVPMGVDTASLNSDALSPLVDPRLTGRRVIGYLGSLDRPRSIENLFPMLAIIREQEPAALLVLAGDTEDAVHREWLRAEARRAGVEDHVLWTGWLPGEQAWRWMLSAEVALSPIPRGPLLDCSSPTKLPEYLALGIPVVCNDNPDQIEVMQGCGAGRCVPYTPRDFAEAVLELLLLPPGERAQMAERGREYVRRHREYRHIAAVLAKRYHQLAPAPEPLDAPA